MSDLTGNIADAARQQSIRAKCFHPTGKFIEFKRDEIEQSIPDRFEQIVRKHPDRLAVKTKSHTLTYDALNRAANRVANAILAQRKEGNEPVALLLEKGTPLIATILGVLKAGKIYVPLDPLYPRARIAAILEDLHPGLIVTDNQYISLASKLAQHGRYVFNIDTIDSSLSTQNLGLSLPPDTLAYIIYTSGSTGQAKGVVHNHRKLLHNTMRNTNILNICASDRLSLLRSCSSAGAVNDTFSLLLNGAAVYPFNIKKEGLAQLTPWLIQEEITIYSSVATVFRHFASTVAEEQLPKVRLVYVGGEPVYKKDVELYRKRFSQCCLFVNRLGASETGTVRYYFVDKETPITGSIVPIGYAAEDMEILLFDEAGKEVGFNDIGEIAVKSRYLSPGYWRKPELTKAAFQPDPEGGDERIYHTGDMGRMLPDGCLEHLGRKDFQVKIRGYSVELTEIEVTLHNLSTIKEAVVVAREDGSGNKRLVAYIAPTGLPAPTVSVLRRVLAEKLPDYMVPSAFVILDALPLTPNGKVDRKALPGPDNSRPELDTSYVGPKTPVEEEMVWIWAEVLKLEQVGVHDNFFDLGGDSLLATRVISRIINTFQIELPVKSLFESPTVADMAVVITQNGAKKAKQEDLTRILAEVEALSDEEAQRLLAQDMREKEL